MLDTYLCQYSLPGDQACLRFKCEAEDAEHAQEQLENAEPTATNIFCEILRRGEDNKRIQKYHAALEHWLAVGYTYDTARALAAVLHGQDEDVRIWANSIRQTQTNLRYEDML